MIVIDDFVKDNKLLRKINTSNFFNDSSYMWWDGWWNSPADTVKKELIQYIWGDNSPMEPLEIKGFEYWTGVYGRDKKELPMHYDKDEQLFQKTGEIVTPLIGTIFYPWYTDIEGGYLEIYSKGENNPPEVIEPKFNRLIIFPAGQHSHRVTPVTKGVRHAIAINLWREPPTGVDSGLIITE